MARVPLGLMLLRAVAVAALVQEVRLLAVVQSWESVPGGRLAVVSVSLALSCLMQVPLLAAVVVAAGVQEGSLMTVVCREVRLRQLWWEPQ